MGIENINLSSIFLGNHSRRKLLLVVLGITAFLLLFVFSGTVSAQSGGGVGGGGSGGGGGGGHQTSYGWGWVIYSANGPGPTDGFRNGALWANAQATCLGAGATQVYAHIINDSAGDGMIYDYLTIQSSPSVYRGKFADGISVDHGKATTIATSTAQNAFNSLPGYGVNTSGYSFGSNVGWFCYNFVYPYPYPYPYPTPPPPPQPPVIRSFSANCTVATVMATTEAGHAYDARLLIDTNGDGVGEDTTILATNIASGVPRDLDTSSFRDFGSNDFYVRVRDRVNGLTDTTQIVRRVAPCVRFSCGQATTSPANPEPGQSFTMTVSFNVVLVSTGAPSSLGSRGTPQPWYIHLQVTPGVFARAQIGSGTLAVGGSSISATSPALSAPVGVYAANWWVRSSAAGPDLNPPGTCGDLDAVTVIAKPYLRVYGGDVHAGSGFGSSCTVVNATARILTFNQGTSPYNGAGTNMAAFANDVINGFASASGGASAKTLSFSNTAGNVTYGGTFGKEFCAPDYWAPAVADPSIIQTSYPAGVRTVPLSNHQAIYVEGDAFINDNILYETDGNWTNLSQIQSFYLIVHNGNILIDKDVTQLNGVFVALSDNPADDNGRIYTCTNGPTIFGTSFAPAECVAKLTINGAFVAKQVRFLRTSGTVNSAVAGEASTSTNIAEVFVFGPELWAR